MQKNKIFSFWGKLQLFKICLFYVAVTSSHYIDAEFRLLIKINPFFDAVLASCTFKRIYNGTYQKLTSSKKDIFQDRAIFFVKERF